MKLLAASLLVSLLSSDALAYGGRGRGRGGCRRHRHHAPTNTNECISLVGEVGTCFVPDPATGLPADLEGCCDTIFEMAKSGCECNAVPLMLLRGNDAVYNFESVCREHGNWGRWHRIPPREERTCECFETYNYGCVANDMQMDAARLQTIFGYQGVSGRYASDECFNAAAIVNGFSSFYTEDVELFAPFGGGLYTGLEGVVEYIHLSRPNVNHGMWSSNGSVLLPPAVSRDGSTWSIMVNQNYIWLRDLIFQTGIDISLELSFRECETKISFFNVLPTDGLRRAVEVMTQAAQFSKRWGVEDICKYHTAYCAGDNSTRQFDSEADCLTYMRALPAYTDACGTQRPLSGNSISCKWKHHLMVPSNPPLHCPHIGPNVADSNGAYKCDDTYECSEDIGQDEWPTIEAIGDDTPAAVRAIFDQSNIGYENEEIACATRVGTA